MARNRNVQIIFWVSEAEKRMIEEPIQWDVEQPEMT